MLKHRENEKLFLTSVLSANTIVNISIAVKCVQLTEELNLGLAPALLWVILSVSEVFYNLLLIFFTIFPIMRTISMNKFF